MTSKERPLVAVIMAGGAGTRFWPASTEECPKQFLALTGPRTLLQMSYDRVVDLVGPERVLVLTNQRYTGLVASQLPELPPSNIIGEPHRRDTAGAVALAAVLAEHRFGSESCMAVLTADHVIGPLEEFHRALKEAVEGCEDGCLYTLGIQPTYPATGFGYLETGEALEIGTLSHFKLKRFKEKPDLETARTFLEQGGFYWNSGMFVWRTQDIVAEFERHLPEHLETLRPVVGSLDAGQDQTPFEKAFERLSKTSVDFAILEKATDVRAVIPKITWDDVGGWLAIGKYLENDSQGNQRLGSVTAEDAAGNVVFNQTDSEPVVLIGVKDLVVVRAEEGTLVVHKDHLDSLKGVVNSL